MEKILRYQGNLGTIYKIWFVNALLTMVTIGIYRPWARTRMRKYLYSQFTIANEPLHYHGTGGELFKGSLKVYGLLFLFFILIGVVQFLDPQIDKTLPMDKQPMTVIGFVTTFISYAAIFFLIHFGAYSGRRYRLARTKWKGIRGAMKGSAISYAKQGILHSLLNFITLGLIIPRNDMRMRKLMMDDTSFGNIPVEFTADPTPLKKIHITTWLLAIPTLGFSRIWYRAELRNQFLKQMKVGNISFDGTQTGGSLFVLTLGNILLAMTIIGIPFAFQRLTNYIVTHTHIHGDVNQLAITQATDTGTATGEVIGEEYAGDDVSFDMGML